MRNLKILATITTRSPYPHDPQTLALDELYESTATAVEVRSVEYNCRVPNWVSTDEAIARLEHYILSQDKRVLSVPLLQIQ